MISVRESENEERITQNEDLTEDIAISSLGIDESILLSCNFHDNIVVLNVSKEFFAQENHQWIQEDFATPSCYEAYDMYGLFQREQHDHNLINEIEDTQ